MCSVCYIIRMSIRNERRKAAIDRMADYLLRDGMGAASLRPLAAAAGTSDRMLLYYFSDREELLTVTLEHIAERLTDLLNQAIPADLRFPPPELLIAIWAVVGSVKLRPYMRLWLELAAAASRDQQPYRAISAAIMHGFVGWVAGRLEVVQEAERSPTTSLLLATIEGALFLDAIGRRDMADLAITRAARQAA